MTAVILAGGSAQASPAERALAAMHPDFQQYVGAVRPIGGGNTAAAALYMALVRPGAADPTQRESAPLIGPGARNDILYDPAVLDGSRSSAWVRLLLDHEYFHARHLAGATSVPLPRRAPAEIERHFLEAAAWGFNVAQARAGFYAGLSESEFREALNRYGEHYRALRDLSSGALPASWESLRESLVQPAALLTYEE